MMKKKSKLVPPAEVPQTLWDYLDEGTVSPGTILEHHGKTYTFRKGANGHVEIWTVWIAT